MSNTEKFNEFHATNPDVYQTLVLMCRSYRSRNPCRQLGIATLWENLRWDYLMNVDHGVDFKLNNNHRAHYSRMIMNQEQDLAGIFTVRDMSAA